MLMQDPISLLNCSLDGAVTKPFMSALLLPITKQEMNSICEQQWQNINQLPCICLVHARLPLEYFHFAVLLIYAITILNVLPAKGINNTDGKPTCPFTLAFNCRPKIGNFRVFGCPTAIKRYTKSTFKGETSRDSSDDVLPVPKALQQAVHGIFIGFPEH